MSEQEITPEAAQQRYRICRIIAERPTLEVIKSIADNASAETFQKFGQNLSQDNLQACFEAAFDSAEAVADAMAQVASETLFRVVAERQIEVTALAEEAGRIARREVSAEAEPIEGEVTKR